jgi:hypothetical protein
MATAKRFGLVALVMLVLILPGASAGRAAPNKRRGR